MERLRFCSSDAQNSISGLLKGELWSKWINVLIDWANDWLVLLFPSFLLLFYVYVKRSKVFLYIYVTVVFFLSHVYLFPLIWLYNRFWKLYARFCRFTSKTRKVDFIMIVFITPVHATCEKSTNFTILIELIFIYACGVLNKFCFLDHLWLFLSRVINSTRTGFYVAWFNHWYIFDACETDFVVVKVLFESFRFKLIKWNLTAKTERRKMVPKSLLTGSQPNWPFLFLTPGMYLYIMIHMKH